MERQKVEGPEKVFFGTRKSDGAGIYLEKPSWQCGWYWGFGYLGNSREHYHLNGYANGQNINMYNALLGDYVLNPKIREQLWEFCEIAKTIYSLKEAAEVIGRGGSHYMKNPCTEIIINKEEVERLNNEVLPALFNAMNEIFN